MNMYTHVPTTQLLPVVPVSTLVLYDIAMKEPARHLADRSSVLVVRAPTIIEALTTVSHIPPDSY